jgi:hypothetical protein
MDIATLPCPICNNVNYEFGSVEHYKHETLTTHTKSIFFRRDGIRRQAFGLFNKIMTESPAQIDRARRCLNCGNVQVFSQPTPRQ